jgi:peptidoglycan/LPS O-acetylase OafA/YrhL
MVGSAHPGAFSKHMPQIDGLRALAILAVVAHHYALLPHIGQGATFGVRLFFVISGFLITLIILKQKDASKSRGVTCGRFAINFYMRRALRLFPVYYLTISIGVALDIPAFVESWPWHVTYLSNIYVAREGQFIFPVGLYWSLSVEEQFYLLWPWAVLLCPRKWLVMVSCLFILSAPLFRLIPLMSDQHALMFSVMLPANFDSLGLGALLAIMLQYQPQEMHNLFRRNYMLPLTIACLLFWLLIQLFTADIKVLSFVFSNTILSLLSVIFVYWAAIRGDSFIGKWLEHPWAQWIGKISYGLYVVHQTIYFLVARAVAAMDVDIPQKLVALVALCASIVIASISWQVLERPINNCKRKFPLTN